MLAATDRSDFSDDAGRHSFEMRVTAESPGVWSAAAASLTGERIPQG